MLSAGYAGGSVKENPRHSPALRIGGHNYMMFYSIACLYIIRSKGFEGCYNGENRA